MFTELYTELLGEVITVKTISNVEIVCKLGGYDTNADALTLLSPRHVVIAGDDVAIVPFTLTSPSAQILVSASHIFSIEKTLAGTAADYLGLIE